MQKPRIERLGHYEIVEEIGRGGMAVVYRGIQSSLNRTVAIKVLPPGFARDKEFIARFDREAETIARLSHPNIIQIIDRGSEQGTCYFVMEYVDGLSLDAFLKGQALTFRQLIEIATQVCRALAYAHAKGIVHRDLKPSNILIAKDSLAVKVADFGLVQLAQSAGELSTLTQSNIAMGTIEYMAPEQRRDARNVDCRADIFALGIILYEMFTGQIPVGHFKRPSELNPEIPRALDQIILTCLEPDPAERFQSAGELARLLQTALGEEPGVMDRIVHTVKSAGERATTAMRGKTRRVAAAGVLLAAAVIAIPAARGCRAPRGAAGTPPRATPEEVPAVEEKTAPSIPPVAAAPTATQPPVSASAPVRDTATPSVAQAREAAPPRASAPPGTPAPPVGAEADFAKAESYAAADMTKEDLRRYAVTSMRAVLENFKTVEPRWAEKAQMRIGQIYEQAGETTLALAEYRRLLDLFPQGSLRADAQYRIAECLKPSGFFGMLDLGRKEKRLKAIDAYDRVPRNHPASPYASQALYQMGLLQEEGGAAADYEAAIGSYERIARDYPASDEAPHALRRVAELCRNRKVKQYEKAVRTYEDILARYPDREEGFHLLLNIALVKETLLNDPQEALEGYRRVIREKPGTKDALEANRRYEALLQAATPPR
ncbi:MAG: protein kinase [Candidatus Aureabacteria bacterium]|nr:protein kinase [Candidatus Auribacterota bacterium]